MDRDKKGFEEMLEKTGGYTGIPVIDIGGTILRGFSPTAVERALRR